MAEVKTYSCDAPGCHNLKKESNHWWIITFNPSGLLLYPMSNEAKLKSDSRTVCGRECVQKIIEQYMETITKT